MTAQPSIYPLFRATDSNGAPLVKGQLFTYQAGTTNPQASYTDSTEGTPNANPVVLNARGEAPVWLNPQLTYKLVLQDQFGNPIWSQDNVPGGYASIITQTTAEAAAGITPNNYSYPPLNPFRYGADGTGGAADTAAIAALTAVLAQSSMLALANKMIGAQLSPTGTAVTPLGTVSGVWLGKLGTSYGVAITNASAATDAHTWQLFEDTSGTLNLQTLSDNGLTARALLAVTRTGFALTAVTFGNATDNPTYSFAGTGAMTIGGALTVTGVLGVNGATGPAQLTGWGTPTGNSAQLNFSGSAATLGQTSAAVAQIIATLKAMGVYGA